MGSTTAPAPPKKPVMKKPNYNLLHVNPLPLTIQALPPLIPHNPLSLLHILYTYLFCRTPCQPSPPYVGFFNPATRSVHVVDARSIQAFWNSGFFGKGSLSRSEPTWISRRRRALGIIGKDEDLTAEEITERRRQERKQFKLERARAEKERIQNQLAQEGKIDLPADGASSPQPDAAAAGESDITAAATVPAPPIEPEEEEDDELVTDKPSIFVEDLEHLQLTPEEAFFLMYGLGALQVTVGPEGNTPVDIRNALCLFRQHSYFPALENEVYLQPDDTFMLNYVVYHHFRSLGWVVRPGVKFGVEYLLYNRGPVFSHAEFGVLIMPSYSHPYWANDNKRKQKELKPWHWLHGINRVSAQVKKTLILVYVEVPSPEEIKGLDVTELLKKYGVREVALRRWLVSRNRD
ncbi:hypothetical protein FN846DRAFT_887211 [Sphaerosporella brunnea]|uniref:tRNA-splicing endonuclease subunit Sen2 n=1 Tax=Sphaerosporella brunnea TaxID=1250544 RepID=A0A5J5F6I3_9PEZI|nr:hypothetical protein FN846DRAFT_887211 [Sphaerosporella brunnea]